MKKLLFIIASWIIVFQVFSQTITPSSVVLGVSRNVEPNNWDITLNPQQLNPGTFILPNQITSIKKIIFNFDFTPPSSYLNPLTNQIIHKLYLQDGAIKTKIGTTTLSPAFATPSNTSIVCSVNFGTISILTNKTGSPVSAPWNFYIESYSSDGFGHETFISSTPTYKFVRSAGHDLIYNNSIGNNQIVYNYFPYTPSTLGHIDTIPTSSDGSNLTFEWQVSNGGGAWSTIAGATSHTYTPPVLYRNTWYRRKVTSQYGIVEYSNTLIIYYPSCPYNDFPNQQNAICGSQSFYNLKDGDIVYPSILQGSDMRPGIATREFGFEYSKSTDNGATWHVVKGRSLIDLNSDFLGWTFGSNSLDFTLLNCAIDPIKFDIQQGPVKKILYRREYLEWYDTWRCGPFNIHPCGAEWHSKGFSNIITITLTSGSLKPVGNISQTLGTNQATCHWNDQEKELQIPLVNNGEEYQWEVPSYYTPYSPLQGAYANTMRFSTNSNPQKNQVRGGEICVTVKQVGYVDRRCFTIQGTQPFSAKLPASIAACEGENIILKPVIREDGQTASSNNYTFSWNAYNSPSTVSCNSPIGGSILNAACKEFKVVVQNAQQYPKQEINLIVKNNYGCEDTAKTVITTSPGWQIGILYSYDDPNALPNSDLTLDAAKNYLYFTSAAGIYRAYFDNGPDKKWKYVLLKDKNTNLPILGDGPLQYYKGTTDKLFYIYKGILNYLESTDQGQSWTSYDISNTVLDLSSRIKIYNNNLYYIDKNSRMVLYKPLSNLYAIPTVVGNVRINTSQNMFTVEDGILAYADEANNMMLYNALTGLPLTITVPADQRQISWNSSINIYAGNIYYVVGQTIRIIKKDINGVYSSYEDVPNGNINQLAGTFTINKQTGTIYAKSYYPEARQIYYLNNTWTSNPIRQYISGGAVGGNTMIYGNGHVYFINAGNILGNAFYAAPCVPSVLRKTADEADPLNDPLSNTLPEIRLLSLTPNPVQDVAKVSFTIPKATNATLRIVTVTGSRESIKEEFIEAGSHEWELNLKAYTAGLYIIELLTDENLYAHAKLIKN
jgi:hypothetical protein